MTNFSIIDRIPLDHVSGSILLAGELIGRTWRTTLSDPGAVDPFHDRGQKRIYVFWHKHLLTLSFYFRNSGKTAVVSESRDGKRASAVAQRWGHAIILGSSSHGGMHVLRSCADEIRNGKNIVITPDGPRGPAENAKPGAAQIALATGAAVVPVAAFPRRAWRLRSWDRSCIPQPFTPITIRVGDPIYPQLSAKEPDSVTHLTKRIQKALTTW
jgi:lysophospholipid acyltransferase (LPLAT)-like uncharacterized protein